MLDTINPVLKLEGRQLGNDWTVIQRLPIRGEVGAEGKTGGNFSVGYIVERTGKQAFMKVFDIANAFASPPERIALELHRISSAYLHEKELLELCRSAKLDRIVQVLDSGTIADGPHPPLFYLIFEQADRDIRAALGALGTIHDAWKFKHLHQVAVGLSQLHRHKVAHQDLKPSNVLLFEQANEGAKIADLGRASRVGKEAEHDSFMIAGDPSYAPPEQMYGFRAPDWVDRREACDLYHLGALICFLFSGMSPTVRVLSIMGQGMWPLPFGRWQGGYQDAVPFLTAAFTKFMAELKPLLPEWCRQELFELIQNACHPDLSNRGDPAARKMVGRPVGIDRYISRLQLLAKKGEIQARLANTGNAKGNAV